MSEEQFVESIPLQYFVFPAFGAKKGRTRVGRGMGSGLGKTCGRGHKGQKARSGTPINAGFQGGQMPIQRSVPKLGFRSRMAKEVAHLRLSELALLPPDTEVTLAVLRELDLIRHDMKRVRVFLSGECTIPLRIAPEIHLTKGAKEAILAAGGSINEVVDSNE